MPMRFVALYRSVNGNLIDSSAYLRSSILRGHPGLSLADLIALTSAYLLFIAFEKADTRLDSTPRSFYELDDFILACARLENDIHVITARDVGLSCC